MAKRGRPAKKRKGGRSLEEIQAQIDAREEAAKKRKEETGLTGAAADSSKQFKTREKYEAVQRAREKSLTPENVEDLQKQIDELPDLDDLLKSVREEIPPDLDELLDSIRKEGKKKTTKKTAAVFPSPKPERKETDSIASENINPVVLRMLGLDPENVVDIDYDTYKRLLREQMAAGRMAGSKLSSEETQLVTEEFKRVKNKTGRFKVKGQKVRASSFVAKKKEKPSGASSFVAGYLPGRGGALVKTPKAEDPGALVATKLSEVNKNVKSAVDSFAKTQKEEKKSKDAERVAASRDAKTAKEEASEAKSIRKQTPKVLKRALAPFTDMFEGISRFLRNVIFGTAVMEILRFLKDPAEFFRPLVEWSNGLIDKFNIWSEKFITDTLKPVNNTIDQFNVKLKEIEDSLNKLLDQIPGRLGMGQMSLGKVPSLPVQTIIEKTRIGHIPNPGVAIQNAFGSLPPSTLGAGKRAPGAVSSSSASDQVSAMGFSKEDFALFRDVVANIESKGKYDIQGGAGGMYAGRYQMGSAARQDAARILGETFQGDTEAARKAFRQDPKMQERYFAAYTRANHNYLMRNPTYAAMSKKQQLQVLGYAHNQGMGAAEKWLKRGMTASGSDAFGTKGSRYSDEIKAAQQTGQAPSLAQPAAASTAAVPSGKPVVAKSGAQLASSSVTSTAPAAPVTRQPRVVALPAPVSQASASGSSSGANQKSVPTFSATDGNNQSMLVIKSIYNIVG